MSKSEADLNLHIKKATSPDETAPKRKHVRACSVYTWEKRSGRAFWAGIKIQPIQSDPVQIFKALITIHKVLQEGHPSVLREAQTNVNWIESLARNLPPGGPRSGGYDRLIEEYVRLLVRKLEFHRMHPDFNGTFEYKEYISLRNIDDPNEGYEAIIDLMNLQDSIDEFQRIVFASIQRSPSNECKISSLTALIAESYGIYRFLTTMIRAMHATTNDDDALEPLRSRYYSQYNRLLNFYYDCSSLKYLTSLITIPNLSPDPPNLYGEFDEDDENAPALPRRPGTAGPPEDNTPISTAATTPAPISQQPTGAVPPEPVVDFWSTQAGQQQLLQQQQQQQLLQQQQYEEEQRNLQAQRDAEIQQQQLLRLQQQQQFEEQQRAQAEQQRLAQEALLRDQLQRQAQGHAAELEREILNLRGQLERNQLNLEQYDQRVKALETELQQLNSNSAMQLSSKDEMIKSVQDQVDTWKNKYEALAKLYSQLRQEHLDLLTKFKKVQAKAASAQEAIDKREKLERDLKAKNIELADLIRERDRARYDLDKSRGSNKDQIEKLERDLRMATDKLNDSERSKGADLSLMLAKHNRELSELEEAIKAKQKIIDSYGSRSIDDGELKDKLQEKEDELEIQQEMYQALTQAFEKMALEKQNGNGAPSLQSIADIIDAILKSSSDRIQDSLFELESPMQAGNQNATPQYLLSVIEKASSSVFDFTDAFTDFMAAEDPADVDNASIINSITLSTTAIIEVLGNSKGITRLVRDDSVADTIVHNAQQSAHALKEFFVGMISSGLANHSTDDKINIIIQHNLHVQSELKKLSDLATTLAPKISSHGPLNSDNLGDVVEQSMAKAAEAISTASARLAQLMTKPRDPSFSELEMTIHDAILSAAQAVTSAIAALIRAASACQQEIVAQGRGSSSPTAFYKKHNRWTEGLISAAKSVAASTNVLIETADGVLSKQNSPEQLIVASNEVAASTAQLVAASRVKSSYMSKTQDHLELASKNVTSACKSLVAQVQDIISKQQRQADADKDVDYSKLTPHVLKRTEMEQQVEILKLENMLGNARKRLGEIRKFSYIDDEDDD
ncbi:uncharacterized protein SAPINGB_P003043 [Magnusiomyces paraingens]|uniref:I/LWEQ domain-containing protein n=1 Tax=Magnusiomyces paraingens TaxID=2606893 RepID=A0A5E8BL42_9ASCO|nr:uncharacterized protein SAPINGB_P003043 [Saprochaete ingens]VVT51277.1 unnamed protein product [Saprochaete ingens]